MLLVHTEEFCRNTLRFSAKSGLGTLKTTTWQECSPFKTLASQSKKQAPPATPPCVDSDLNDDYKEIGSMLANYSYDYLSTPVFITEALTDKVQLEAHQQVETMAATLADDSAPRASRAGSTTAAGSTSPTPSSRR